MKMRKILAALLSICVITMNIAVTAATEETEQTTEQTTVETTYRLEAETNDETNFTITDGATKVTVHNSNYYITWNVNIEQDGYYEFKLRAGGFQAKARPVIKVDDKAVIQCEINNYADGENYQENVVGTAALTSGTHKITLYNPYNGYFTSKMVSSSMYVDWLEISKTSGITKFRLECEGGDVYVGGDDRGDRRGLFPYNQSVTWNNIEIEEPGMYRFTIAAEGYDGTANPIIYVSDRKAVYGAKVLKDVQGVYEMGTYAMNAGKYSVKLEVPKDDAIMYADYVEIERISGLTQYVLEFENADKYDYKGAKIVDNATGVSFYNSAAWAEWNVNVSGGEYEFVLKASTAAGTKSKPVMFVDDKAVVQTSYSSAESWANVDTNICRIYLEEGKHTIKMYNPQNVGDGENANGIYESSESTFADKLTVRKMSNVGLTSVKKAGELTAKANTAEYGEAVLVAAEYDGDKLINITASDAAQNNELETRITLSDVNNTLKLFLWDGMTTIVPYNNAKDY